MNLYRTTFFRELDPEGKPSGLAFHGSASDASKGRTAAKKEYKHADPTTETVDVKTTKQELLILLNELANRNNDRFLEQV